MSTTWLVFYGLVFVGCLIGILALAPNDWSSLSKNKNDPNYWGGILGLVLLAAATLYSGLRIARPLYRLILNPILAGLNKLTKE